MTVLTLVFKLPIKNISNIFIPDTFLRQYLDTVKVILIGFKCFKIVVPYLNNKDKTTEAFNIHEAEGRLVRIRHMVHNCTGDSG